MARKKQTRAQKRTSFRQALDTVVRVLEFPFGQFGRVDPIAPELNAFSDEANLVATRALSKVAEFSETFAVEAVKLHDLATDLVGKLGKVVGLDVIDELQELIDFPIMRVQQGISIVAQEIISNNNSLIRKIERDIKARRGKNGTGN